jgi:Beta-glucosidase/6-phospho-beta-glucosidase/beta-galactosidase
MSFKKDFIWGSATASYQIEGAAYEDGKGLSIWDVFCKEPGNVFGNHSGDVACDHYHKYKEDVQLMKELGIKAYRFSLSWPRIMPDGTGAINEKGIEFYSNLIDELIAAGITPYITLFHWDYPYALHKRGAWMNPDSSDWFADYAKVVAERFGDRVKHFFTINEPQCFIGGIP